MSAIMIRLIERALVRFEKPATLTDRDRETLNALLEPDEYQEVIRIRADISHVRDLRQGMLMMTPEFAEAELALTNYGVDLYWEEREYNRHANTMRKAKEKLPGTSPGVRQGLEANIANRKLGMAGHLANSVKFFDALPPMAKRFLEPFERPATSFIALCRSRKDRDIVFFPDELTAWQQAYKEVFERKLKDLRSL